MDELLGLFLASFAAATPVPRRAYDSRKT